MTTGMRQDAARGTAGLLTGRKVLLIAFCAFLVMLAPNIVLSVAAVRTFSGLVVPNSYVASQEFDRARTAQVALGWSVELTHEGDELRLAFTDAAGHPVHPPQVSLMVGRTTTTRNDVTPELLPTPSGYAAAMPLAPGRWRAEVTATAADGTPFHQSRFLFVGP